MSVTTYTKVEFSSAEPNQRTANKLNKLKDDLSTAIANVPTGGGGGTGVVTFGETPTGAINGSNVSFTSANAFAAGKLAVFLNGLRQRRGQDYNETGANSFSFLAAPLSGDSLSIDYVVGTGPALGSPTSAYGSTPLTLWSTGAGYTAGTKFTLVKAGQVKALRFYRSSSSTATSRQLRLYNSDGSTLLGSVSTSGESGTGWYDVTLSTPVAFAANDTVVIAVDQPDGVAYDSHFASLDPNITWLQTAYVGGLGNFPSTDASSYNYGADVTVQFSL